MSKLPSKTSKNNSERHTQDYAGKDGAGRPIASAQDIQAAGFNLNLELRDRLLPAVGSRWSYNGKPETLLATLGGIAAVKIDEFRRNALVKPEPFDLPLVVEILNGLASLKPADRNGGPELESATLEISAFQVTAEPIGDTEETIFKLGTRFISLEEFVENFSCENETIERGMQALAEVEKERRLAYEKAIAALPPKPTPQGELGTAIAAGVVAALNQMGIKPQPVKA